MKWRACKTCKFYKGNVEKQELTEKDRVMFTLSSAYCMHELSNNNTFAWMIYHGPCGRDLKLWERKSKVYDEIEILETD